MVAVPTQIRTELLTTSLILKHVSIINTTGGIFTGEINGLIQTFFFKCHLMFTFTKQYLLKSLK